jgi:hypothetical protein
LVAARTGCVATVSIIGRGIHVKERLALASGSSRAVRATARPRRLPVRVTITVALPTGTRAWRTRLVR